MAIDLETAARFLSHIKLRMKHRLALQTSGGESKVSVVRVMNESHSIGMSRLYYDRHISAGQHLPVAVAARTVPAAPPCRVQTYMI